MLNEKRKCFIMYNNFYNQIELLTMTERGELLTAIYKYVLFDFISDDLSPIVNMAFSFIRDTVDRDNEAYEETCKRNAENGRKGGRPKKVDGSKTEGFFEYPKKPDKDIDKDIDKDKDKDIDKDKDKDKDKDMSYASACPFPVSDAYAPQLDEEDKKYLIEKGIPRGYIEERAERAEAYARDNGMDVQEVIRRWWQTDRATPPWNGERAYKMGNSISNNTNGFSERTPREQTQKAREAEDWFEARLRKTFGDDA